MGVQVPPRTRTSSHRPRPWAAPHSGAASLSRDKRWQVSGDATCAGTPSAALVFDHNSVLEDLSAPHAPGFRPLNRPLQAGLAHSAPDAYALGLLDPHGLLRKEDLRIHLTARQFATQTLHLFDDCVHQPSPYRICS